MSAPQPTVVIGPFVVGEKPAPLLYGYEDSSGAALDITGYTVRFEVWELDSGSTMYTGNLPNSGSDGVAEYIWTGAEFPTAGRYRARFWVGNGAQRFASILIEFGVAVDHGPPPSI